MRRASSGSARRRFEVLLHVLAHLAQHGHHHRRLGVIGHLCWSGRYWGLRRRGHRSARPIAPPPEPSSPCARCYRRRLGRRCYLLGLPVERRTVPKPALEGVVVAAVQREADHAPFPSRGSRPPTRSSVTSRRNRPGPGHQRRSAARYAAPRHGQPSRRGGRKLPQVDLGELDPLLLRAAWPDSSKGTSGGICRPWP